MPRDVTRLSIQWKSRRARSRRAAALILVAAAGAVGNASAQTPGAGGSGDAASAALPEGRPLSILDAVRTTIRRHPAIQTAEALVRQSRALLAAAEGPFDSVITASLSQTHSESPVLQAAELAPGENALRTDTTALNVGASEYTTWGTTITESAGLSRVYQRANVPIQSVGFMATPGQYAIVGLNVTQPILRGAGTVGAASAIAAAKLARDAAAHNLDGAAQAQVYLTLVAYFQVVAAAENVALLQEAETAARKVVDDTRALVEGQQRPRSDLPSLEGNLANRTRARIEAEDDRIQAVQALQLAMGLGADASLDVRATDGFPDPSTPTPDRDTVVRLALRDRGDLVAAHETVAAVGALVDGAEHNSLPSLDLNLSVGYAGALQNDGAGPFFSSLWSNVPGVNGGVGLSLALPLRNEAQIADRDLKRAQLDQAKIVQHDLERQVPVAVEGALRDLALARSALAAASEAVKQFGQAVADQRDKLHEGVGTVIDLVLTEELLIGAEESRTANQLRCASALARVFYEMGALPASDAGVAALARPLGLGDQKGP